MNPKEISSICLFFNIFVTIYNENYILLITEIPLSTTSILHHHKLVPNIQLTDIIVAQTAFWQHLYYAYYYSNLALHIYLLCPILFIISYIFHYKNEIYTGQIYHASMHYMLSIGTVFLNLKL